MELYWPNRYIDNYFPKRYFQIKDGEVVVPIPQIKQEISLGGYSPLVQIDREELFKEISLKLPNTKIIPLLNKLFVKIENNEEDEAIAISLIYSKLQHKENQNKLNYFVQLIIQIVEIIESEEEIEKENENIMNIIEELNKLKLI